MTKTAGSPLTPDAVLYTWRQLAQRIGVSFSKGSINGFDEIGIPIFYGEPEQAQFHSPGLIICRCDDPAWDAILNASDNGLSWKPVDGTIPAGTALPFDNPIPVLFWGKGYENGNHPFAERRTDGSIIFYADILAASFFLLSRWEEMVLPVHDEHGRFPASASTAYRHGFLDLPLVDQYALILRAWLHVVFPQITLRPPQFKVKLSHDIDHIRMYSSWKRIPEYIKRHLFRDRSIIRVIRAIASGMFFRFDPYFSAIFSLAKLSESHGFKSAFYFMTSSHGLRDEGYWESNLLGKKLVQMVKDRGHEVGFHPGYETHDNLELLVTEKGKLEKLLAMSAFGGRQHYLRFRVPATWRSWEQAGLQYDSTLGFPEHEGFRCGTCHPYHPFDLEQNREMAIVEIPLIVMDVTLISYQKLSPEQAQQSIRQLAHRCAEVGGIFTLLWHNTTWDRTRSALDEMVSWSRVYVETLDMLRHLQEGWQSLSEGGTL